MTKQDWLDIDRKLFEHANDMMAVRRKETTMEDRFECSACGSVATQPLTAPDLLPCDKCGTFRTFVRSKPKDASASEGTLRLTGEPPRITHEDYKPRECVVPEVVGDITSTVGGKANVVVVSTTPHPSLARHDGFTFEISKPGIEKYKRLRPWIRVQLWRAGMPCPECLSDQKPPEGSMIICEECGLSARELVVRRNGLGGIRNPDWDWDFHKRQEEDPAARLDEQMRTIAAVLGIPMRTFRGGPLFCDRAAALLPAIRAARETLDKILLLLDEVLKDKEPPK